MSDNLYKFNQGVDLWLKQVKTMSHEQYQDLVWTLFLRLVRETPQSSGKAVANWNISIGTPNMDFDDSLGDPPIETSGTYTHGTKRGLPTVHLEAAHVKGDRKWETVAWNRNRPIKNRIKYTDKVFICNGVMGDEKAGDGHTTFAYMQAMQNPEYWAQNLRLVNQPYEMVQESVLIVATTYIAKGLGLSKVGGNAMEN